MTTQYIPGPPIEFPALSCLASWTPPVADTGVAVDVTTTAVQYVGRVTWASLDSTSKSCVGVHYAVNASVTTTMTLRLSIEGVSTGTAGPPMRGDGTALATVTYTDPVFATGWVTATFAASCTIAFGQHVAVVFQASAYTAGTITLRGLNGITGANDHGCNSIAVRTTGTVVAIDGVPNIIFEFADGTYGTLAGAFPYSALNSEAFASNTAGVTTVGTGDERGMEICPPVPIVVVGVRLPLTATTSLTDFCIHAYTSTTAVATVTVDGHQMVAISGRPGTFMFGTAVSVAAGATLIVALAPQVASNITMYSFSQGQAANRAGLFGTHINWVARVDGGAWTRPSGYDARQFAMALLVQGFSDGAGSGGGGGGIFGSGVFG